MSVDVWADWRTRAACKSNPDRQFPGWNAERIADAKAVCAVCPVRQECLQTALDLGESDGVWGGLTATERERFKEGAYTRQPVQCPGCGRPRALTTEGRIRLHKGRAGGHCTGSGSKA